MTATQDETIAEPQRAVVALQERLGAALTTRTSEYDERVAQQAATIDVLQIVSTSPGAMNSCSGPGLPVVGTVPNTV